MKARAALLAAAALASVLLPLPLVAQPVELPGGGMLQVKVRSLAEMRFKGITRQSRDLSCGAAAVSTLLEHGYGLDASEGEVIESIFEITPEDQHASIARQGFSLLELKRYLEARGFAAGGFQLDSIDKLANLKVPVIALINVRGYNHFVVIKRVEGDKVLIADPAFGNSRPTLEVFAGSWDGIILAAARADIQPDPEFMQDPTILARPGDLRSIAVALGSPQIALPGEY